MIDSDAAEDPNDPKSKLDEALAVIPSLGRRFGEDFLVDEVLGTLKREREELKLGPSGLGNLGDGAEGFGTDGMGSETEDGAGGWSTVEDGSAGGAEEHGAAPPAEPESWGATSAGDDQGGMGE